MEFDANEDKRRHRVCELCNRVIIGDREWAGRAQRGEEGSGCAQALCRAGQLPWLAVPGRPTLGA